MMLALLAFIPVLLVTVSVAEVHASASYGIPNNITANQPTQLTIDVRVDADSELRQRFNAYRVFLAVKPPGWGLGPICWLAHDVGLDTHDVTVTIPADVVPDETRVYISTGLIYKRNRERVNGFNYSGYTLLLGGNATWSQRELDGWVIGNQDTLSCWAYGCARGCYEKYYTGDSSRISDGTGDKEADNCVNQCAARLNTDESAAGKSGASAPIMSTMLISTVITMITLQGYV
jgi:hypothetical protein